eukprot:3740258-Alexandrium_andersonii.AAC.1
MARPAHDTCCKQQRRARASPVTGLLPLDSLLHAGVSALTFGRGQLTEQGLRAHGQPAYGLPPAVAERQQ